MLIVQETLASLVLTYCRLWSWRRQRVRRAGFQTPTYHSVASPGDKCRQIITLPLPPIMHQLSILDFDRDDGWVTRLGDGVTRCGRRGLWLTVIHRPRRRSRPLGGYLPLALSRCQPQSPAKRWPIPPLTHIRSTHLAISEMIGQKLSETNRTKVVGWSDLAWVQ